MNKHSALRTPHSAVVIVGAGPAGSSLAIRLAKRGFAVTLIEKDRFPREKLCGEFLSPECFRHFDELGVRSELFAKGGDRVAETRFYGRTGRSVAVPTAWFGGGEFALSLSRAEMDLALLNRAKAVGVEVIENGRVVSADFREGEVRSIVVRTEKAEDRFEIFGDIFIDASGRSAVFEKLIGSSPAKAGRNGFVGFKAHLRDVTAEPGVCEIFFFDGGYGGLSHVEQGKANFCFLVTAELAKQSIGKTNELFGFILEQNNRAKERMQHASAPARLDRGIGRRFRCSTRHGAGQSCLRGGRGCVHRPFHGKRHVDGI